MQVPTILFRLKYWLIVSFHVLALPNIAYSTLEISSITHITGNCNGAIDITAQGTAGPFTFVWTGPNGFSATTEDISGLCDPGIYTVTILFNSSVCTTTLSATIFACGYEISPSSMNITPVCTQSGQDGKVDITNPIGGIPPYSYLWSTGATTQDIDNLPIGNYCVTITDGAGCKSIPYCAQVKVADPLIASINANPPNPSCIGFGLLTAIISGGKNPLSYSWNTGENVHPYISVNSSGEYSVTVTDACSASTIASINYIADPVIDLSIIAPAFLCNSDLTTINAQVQGGESPFSYMWNTGSTTQGISNIGHGTYTVTVTDSNGCTKSKSHTISAQILEFSSFSITDNTIFGSCAGNGSVSVIISGGTEPYQYSWSGQPGFIYDPQHPYYITSLTGGNYCVTVTDNLSCSLVKCFFVQNTNDVNISLIENLSYCIENYMAPCQGKIWTSTSGSGSYTYNWVGPNGFVSSLSNIENLCEGVYTVTITNAVGCTKVLYERICCCFVDYEDNHPPPAYSHELCYEIQHPSLSDIQATYIKPKYNQNNGSIDITILGAGPNKVFRWTGPNGYKSTYEDIGGLAPGNYCVTVTDGCSTQSKCINLNQCSESLPYIYFYANPNCEGFVGSNAAGKIILANPTFGDSPYTYSWSNGSTSKDLTNLDIGTFTVTITDNGGCTTTETISLTYRSNPDVAIIANSRNCEKRFSCNDKTIVEPWSYISEFVDCNTFNLYCDLIPEQVISTYSILSCPPFYGTILK